MRSFHVLAFAAMAALAAGCGGGGATSTPPSVANPTTPGTPAQSNAKQQAVEIDFTMPRSIAAASVARRGKTRAYVSPSAQGAVLVATSTTPANSASYGYDLSTLCKANAAGAGSTCKLAFPLNVDTYSITVSLYDQAQSAMTTAAPVGNELGIDTETYTVVTNTKNKFNFYLLAVVEGFKATIPTVTSTSTAAPVVGAVGTATAPATTVVKFSALDPSGNPIDQYSGFYGFAPATSASSPPASSSFLASIANEGDTTGCTSCSSVSNDNGTSTVGASAATIMYPNGGGPAPGGTGSTTDENLTFSFSGGGGIGSGIEGWTTATTSLAGTQTPYYADVTVADTTGNPFDNATNGTSYTIPNAYIAPLYGYVTDGNGNALSSTSSEQAIYVWAAQAALPTGTNADGTSYAISIATPSDCAQSGNALVTIGSATYYQGYGSVFAVTPNSGGYTGNCTLTIADGGGDTTTASVYISTPGSTVGIPAPSSPPATPAPFVREHPRR